MKEIGFFVQYPAMPPILRIRTFHISTARDGTRKEEGGWHGYDQSYQAQNIMKVGYNSGHFIHISIPFTSSSPLKEESLEEIISRKSREKLWSEAPVVKPEFCYEGDKESEGRDSIPIPRDDSTFVCPSIVMVKAKNYSLRKESKDYDQSSKAQRMLKGEYYVYVSHLSIPFPSPCSMKVKLLGKECEMRRPVEISGSTPLYLPCQRKHL
ncbi:hypothetical protein ADUPG1_012593 [Aduncisulcus paluster]|uniref:Uncharacterized protein n=1 Tax=Aduncisulcus paluster TaxID=2918883 RepID=A0ABQ5K1T6_9EUKA|nr:hypothetical protein ADUPG1_012593 [Aduncisulcus paluster]